MLIVLNVVVLLLLLSLAGAGICLFMRLRAVDARIERAAGRLRVIAAAKDDADRLSQGRARFRRRQQAVESAVAIGTAGLETAHRTLASRLGSTADGSNFYGTVQRLNTQIGRSLSGLIAPRARRRDESMDDWKRRRNEASRLGQDRAVADDRAIEHGRPDEDRQP